MTDRRNCILEYSTIKKCIPNNYLNFFRNENEDIDNEVKSRNKMKSLNNLKLTDIKGKIINAKDVKAKNTCKKFLIRNHYQNVKINGIIFIMKNFIGQIFGLISKGRTSVTQLKNSNGNASITLFMLKVDFEHLTYPMENIIFVKNQIVKKISNTSFLNAV